MSFFSSFHPNFRNDNFLGFLSNEIRGSEMRKNPTDPTMVGNLNEKVRKIEMNGKKQTSLGAPENDHINLKVYLQ